MKLNQKIPWVYGIIAVLALYVVYAMIIRAL